MNTHSRKNMLWGGLALFVVVVLIALAKMSGPQSADVPGDNGAAIAAVTEDEHIKGNPEAPVTIIEYSDFQCPACAAMYPRVKAITRDFSDDVRFVYRHFPLTQIHPNAQLAGQASEAADMQGTFWEYHDLLFERQNDWAQLRGGDVEDFFVGLAGELELDTEKFRQDMESREARTAVVEDSRDAAAANLPGTPTFFMNGEIIATPTTYDAFATLIRDELQRQETSS